jgi:Phosphate-selective porin O and P
MKMLKTILFVLVTVLALNLKAQEPTVSEKLTEVNDKVNGLLERVATDEADLQKLAKIKVSGYIQAQYQNFETPTLLAKSQNYFSLRRVRVKFTYEAADGIKFVLQPDFAPGNLSLKDAYAVVNDRWTKSWSLWAGKFNRPNYEVEYSSSQREILERSLVIRTLYPGERAIGAKLEYNPQSTPIHMQVAILNGADGIAVNNAAGTNLNAADNIDYDNSKDIMARVTYNLPLGSFGGLDFGAHGYFGSLKSMTTLTYNSNYTSSTPSYVGEKIGKNWLGGEFQLFADVLGGLSVKGEYISGKNASIGYAPAGAVLGSANFVNNFAGSYLYVIKNLGKRNQLAFRYDYYDPNTDIKGEDVTIKKYDATSAWVKKASSKSDLATTTYGIAFHHYLDDNVRITFNYDIVQNEKVGQTGGISNIRENYTQADGQVVTNGIDYGTIIPQNVFSIRIQAKF